MAFSSAMSEHVTFECSNLFTPTTAISYSFMNPLIVSLQTTSVKCFFTFITVNSYFFLLGTHFVSITITNIYSFMNPILVSLQTTYVKCFSTLITINSYFFLLGTHFVSIQLVVNFITSLLV